jgi:PAS domain S-box-containing protein
MTPDGGSPAGDLELRKFRKAVDQTAHAVYITDTDGVIEYVNPAFEEITGYEESAVMGESTALLNSGEHDEELYEDLWETILDGEQWEHEMVDERKDGERLVLEQTISPVRGEEGELRNFVAVAQDVTDHRAREDRLQKQRDDLELLNNVLRHDIRNHLQVVTAYTELLADHVDEEGAEYLETIRESAENAIGLTSTAKEVAEVMLQTTGDTATVALRSVLNRELEEVRSSHREAVVRVDGSVPRVDVVANSMLGSVFRNLLKNAIQHNDKPVPEVTVSVEVGEDRVHVRVADNGPGIPDEQKPSVFGKGEKGLDSAGTGIGLYLVRSLVDNYGADIHIEDNDPEGSVFVLDLARAE